MILFPDEYGSKEKWFTNKWIYLDKCHELIVLPGTVIKEFHW